MTSLLSAAGVVKYCAGRRLLDIAELSVERGDCVVLLGDNGAGKTTLLKILGGLTAPDSLRRFCFEGREITPAAGRGRIVYLHQSPYLLSTTVLDNVIYGLRMQGKPRAVCRAEAEESLRWAGIASLANRPPGDLSGGEKQRAALARLYALRPTVYLLDEPTAYLDGDGKATVTRLIARLPDTDAATVIATHDPALFVNARRHWRLENGKISADGV